MSLSNLISSVEESRTLSVTGLIKKLKAEGKDVISFSAGEPDFPTPDFIKQAAIKAINENYTYYTPNEGSPALINAIVNKFKNENDIHFEAKNILVSNGAKHSIYNILMALCNPADEVIFQSPYWVSYPEMVKLAQAKSVIINSDAKSNFKITPSQLRNVLSDRTKVFIFNSPSNPTGAVYSKDEILALADVLKESKCFIISDEIYEKILYDDAKHFSIGAIDYLRERTITVNGLSKAYSMTGWRIGYAGGPADVIKFARNLQSHSTSNAVSISQAASVAALTIVNDEVEKMVKEFSSRRNFLVKKLNEIDGILCPNPSGAFYVFFDVSTTFGKNFEGEKITDSTSFCNFLLKTANVGLVPGIAFGDDNCVRMSYACSVKDLEDGVRRIKNALASLGA